MLKCSGTVFANLACVSKDLVPLFDPKVHLFENSSLKIDLTSRDLRKSCFKIGRSVRYYLVICTH